MYVRLKLWVRPSFTAPWASPHYLSSGRSSQSFALSGTLEEREPPNQHTLAWTYWWAQWLASLLDKGLWSKALVVECNGIENLVLLYKTWRSNITIVTVVLYTLTWFSIDKAGKEEIMRVKGWKIPFQTFEYCRRIPHPGAAPLTVGVIR